MPGKPHAYYEAIQRIVDAHSERWTISSLATAAKLDISTIRKAIEAGSAPSMATVQKLGSVLGLDYDGVVNWRGEPLDPEKTREIQELREIGFRLSSDDRKRLVDIARRLDALEHGPSEAEDGDDQA